MRWIVAFIIIVGPVAVVALSTIAYILERLAL